MPVVEVDIPSRELPVIVAVVEPSHGYSRPRGSAGRRPRSPAVRGSRCRPRRPAPGPPGPSARGARSCSRRCARSRSGRHGIAELDKLAAAAVDGSALEFCDRPADRVSLGGEFLAMCRTSAPLGKWPSASRACSHFFVIVRSRNWRWWELRRGGRRCRCRRPLPKLLPATRFGETADRLCSRQRHLGPGWA